MSNIKSNRSPLLAAKYMLTANNVCVTLSACALLALINWHSILNRIENRYLHFLLIAIAIIICATSLLASIGTKIILTKDWIVVICNGNNDKLASKRDLVYSYLFIETNAMLLRIDQTTMIVSPLLAGQLMTSFGISAGLYAIIGWNLCSFAVEYFLLIAIYRSVPMLAQKSAIRQGISDLTKMAGNSNLQQLLSF